MKLTKLLSPWPLWLGFVFAVLGAAAIGINSVRERREAAAWSNWIIHTQRVLATLDEARILTFQILYAASFEQPGSTAAAKPRADSIQSLRGQVLKLRYLTLDNREEQNRLDKIDRLQQRLVAVAGGAAGNTTAFAGPFPPGVQLIAGMRGILNGIREPLDDMSATERELLDERRARLIGAMQQSQRALELWGGVIGLWLFGLVAIAILKSKQLAHNTEVLSRERAELSRAKEHEHGERRFRRLLESAPDALFILDSKRRILMVNTQAEKLFAYTREQLIGRDSWTLVPQRFHALRFETLGPGVELYGLRADGTEFPIEAALSPLEDEEGATFCAAVRDITERKRLEAEAWQSQEHFRLMILGVKDYAIVMFDPQGRIVTWNEGAERLKGYRSEEIIGRPFSMLYAPEDQKSGKPAHDLEAARCRGSYASEGWRVRKDGSRFLAEYVITPLCTAEGEIRGFAEITRDITERKRNEEVLRQAEQMTEMDRLRKEFLARISHELRTPLNAIIGTTELRLLAGGTPEQRHDLETIQSSGELLLKIVNDLLELSKLTVSTPVLETLDFNLPHLLEGIVDSLAVIARKKSLELTLYLDPAIPAGLRGDPVKLRQILNNLLANAIKFTPAGDVLLNAKLEETTATEAVLKFEVIDTGIGIAPEVQSRLFQPFVQADESTHRRFGGTGLGLSIAGQLIAQMGGKITVQSEPGQGSTFSFTLQFVRGAEIARSWTIGALLPPSLTVRALIIDDSAVHRDVISKYLTAWGIANCALSAGESALEELRQAQEQHRPYALLLLDEAMPGVSGFSIARQVKQHPLLCDTKVVLMTTADNNPAVAEPEVDGFVFKPVRPSRLFNAVHELFAGYSLSEAKPEAPGSAPEPEPSSALYTKGRILVVEDNVTNQQVAARQLGTLGYETKIVGAAQPALEELIRAHYDAVLLDCELPDMDGYAAAQELRGREVAGQHVPVIALTAHASEGQREKCLAAGMDDFLSKPVRLAALAQCLEMWVNGKPHSDNLQFSQPTTANGEESEDDDFDAVQLAAIEKLSRADGPNALRKLIDEFLRDASARIQEIKYAIEAKDAGRAGFIAHSLVSAAAVLGAMRFSRLCTAIESRGRVDGLQEIASLVRDLEEELLNLPIWFERHISVDRCHTTS